MLLAGAWLAASPLLAGYTRIQVASWHNALAGPTVVVLTATAVRVFVVRRTGRTAAEAERT